MAAGAGRPKVPALPRAVRLLGWTSFVTDLATEMIFPLIPAFLGSIGGGPAALGLIEGLADAVAAALKWWSGRASDRWGVRKPFVLAGYGLAALSRPLVAFAVAPWHILAVRVIDRVGKGLRSAPRDAMLASAVTSDTAGRAFGFHRAMDHAGAVVGPLVASALLWLGAPLTAVFLLAAIPGLASIALVSALREAPPPPRAAEAGEPAVLPRALWTYLAVVGVFSLASATDALLLLRARELGVADAIIPLLWSAFHVSKVVSAKLGGGWADRMPRVWLVGAGWSVFSACYLGFAVATSPGQVAALFLVFGAHYGLTEPAQKAMVRDLAPPAHRGQAFGAWYLVTGAAAVPAGLGIGGAWQLGGAPVALTMGAALGAGAVALLGLWQARYGASAPPVDR